MIRRTAEPGSDLPVTIPTIFDACRPRPDVLDGAVADADFAADLAQVLTGQASAAYRDPVRFFANTWPTRGLKQLLANVCRRLSGAGGAVGPIFRLDTAYGGGKTHGLIALAHAARGLKEVPGAAEFVDPALPPAAPVRIAAFDGENADPANGRALEGGVFAHTPWGEIAHALGGTAGYERVRRSDEDRMAPGADTLRSLIGDAPALILLDELSVYLRKVRRLDGAGEQLTAFLTSLFKAVETAPHAALVHTLAAGKDGARPAEAYAEEHQSAFLPALTHDVASGRVEPKALAETIDAEHHRGLPPYAAYAARTIFLHTLAFNDPLKGLTPEQLRYAAVGPAVDPSFLDEARKRFVADSAYLDDRTGAPLRFLAEANLSQIVRREEEHVDPGEARAELNDGIRRIFDGATFEAVPFPGGPFDVPDEVGDGRPKLVVFAYDGVTVGSALDEVPALIARVYERAGADGAALRKLRNHVVFAAADDGDKEAMQRRAYRRLALQRLKTPDRLADLAEHQQDRIREWEAKSEHELAVAVQQCYRHVFYPSRDRLGDGGVALAHSALDIHSTSDRPGAGQQHIARALRDLGKLRSSEDEPNSPTYVRDRTPLKKGQLTTRALRDEFRRDPGLPILLGDDIFVRGIRRGIEQGDYVYQRGDLLFGPGDPPAAVRIDEQAVILTMAYARGAGVWPRLLRDKPDQPYGGEGSGDGGGPEPPPGGGGRPGPTPEGDGRTPPPPVAGSFSAEGVLKDALTQLWEQARARRADAVATLTIRMFEAGDAFPLLGAVGAVAGAEKRVDITGGYETRDGGSFQLEFAGPVPDAQPVREFLEPQLRDAVDRSVEAAFTLTFPEGLPMAGDAAEKLTVRLCRFASGAAHVSATAEAQP